MTKHNLGQPYTAHRQLQGFKTQNICCCLRMDDFAINQGLERCD